MKTIFDIQKNIFDQFSKQHQAVFDQLGPFLNQDCLDIQKWSHTTKQNLRDSSQKFLCAQEAFHKEALVQMERFKNDFNAPLIEQYKTATTSFNTMSKEIVDKIFV